MKKFICVVLSFFMIIGCLPLTTYAAEKICDCDILPIVYVRGRTAIYTDKNDPTSVQLPNTSDEYIEEAAKALIKPFAKGLLTNDYSEYTQVLAEKIKVIYDDFAPDENGNLPGNTGGLAVPTPTEIGDIHKNADISNSYWARKYNEGYLFSYDCRRSPVDIADDLNAYIEEVKAVTGHSKVNMITRCMGTCIASAYFAEYGWESVHSVIIYNTTSNGTDVLNNCFTGNISLNAEALDHFASQELTENTPIMDLIKATITVYNKTYGLTIASDFLNILLNAIVKEAAPEIIRSTYGTMGGYWAMVGGDYYEQARDFVFPEEVADKYATLISKFDEYYYNVSSHISKLFTEMAEDGVQFNVIAKYNFQLYPVGKSSNETSDGIITVSQQSFGATAADYGYCLSNAYIKKAMENGTYKYISSDKIIDASTALFPDHTWFIKDMKHNVFPMEVDSLMARLMLNPAMTVWDDENYPQYMVCMDVDNITCTLVPLTEENSGTLHLDDNAFKSIRNFILKLIAWFHDLIRQ